MDWGKGALRRIMMDKPMNNVQDNRWWIFWTFKKRKKGI